MSPRRHVLGACLLSIGLMLSFEALALDISATPPPSVKDPSTVVAKQGGASVTLADVDAFAARIPEKERAVFFSSPQRIENLITSLLVQEQLAAEARASGLDRDPGVRTQIVLADDDVLSKARISQLHDSVKIPNLEEMAKEEYIGHKERYMTVAILNVKHILIDTKTRSEDEARALADKVDKEAKAEPDHFGDLVDKYSDDPSKASNHGLMTDVSGDRYVPEFIKASEALKKPGDISPPVKTKFGFHIIMLVRRSDAHQRSFAEVKNEILAKLRQQYVDKYVTNHTDEIRNRPVDATPEVVASLRTRFGTITPPEEMAAKANAGK